MGVLLLVPPLVGAATLLAFTAFVVVSWKEGERRAARVSAAIGASIGIPLLVVPLVPRSATIVALAGLGAAIAAAAAAWLAPLGRSTRPGGRPSGRIDERDVMFARNKLTPGSPEFEAYYAMHPENRASDDRFRALPGLLSRRSSKFDPALFATAEALFDVCEALRPAVDGDVAEVREERTPAFWAAEVKRRARGWGAVAVGVTELRPYHVYSHVGRGSGEWGAPVDLAHRWAVAFTVEMDHEAMAFAPEASVIVESARQYVAAASIAVRLARFMRGSGYPARAHIDGDYRVIAPLVARDAGLGEIGRMGIVMTPRLGPRVRLGVVTTDLPLVADRPGDDRSVLDFCTICRKCATCCPVGAIPAGERQPVAGGGLRWKLNDELCFRYWSAVGTDCGMCMRVCPYSHPDNVAHNIVRWAVRRSGGMRRMMLAMDDLFYGRRPAARPLRETPLRAGKGEVRRRRELPDSRGLWRS